MKTIAIMQPTFLPWIGYFGLMDAVDEFVFLDDVQFSKRSWQQRNQIKTANGPHFITAPVKATQGQTIDTIQIAEPLNKLIKTIDHNYSNAPYYDTYGRIVKKILGYEHKYLCSLNFHLMEYFISVLGIDTKLSCSSQMQVSGKKADLLAEICEQKCATHYLSPPGSRAYLDAAEFPIPYAYFDFKHPEYKQLYGEFTPYMSIIDLLFNEGPRSMEIIRRGYEAGCNPGAGGIKADTGEKHQGIHGKAHTCLHDRGSAEIRAV